MVIVGVDPGPETSGYVVWDHAEPKVLESGTAIKNDVLLRAILPRSLRLQQQHALVILAIERAQALGRPAGRALLDTVFFSGQVAEYWRLAGGRDPFLVEFGDVSRYFCHSRHAKESYIRQTLLDRFGAPGTKKKPGAFYGVHGHAWSALALAVAVADSVACPEDVDGILKRNPGKEDNDDENAQAEGPEEGQLPDHRPEE
ncbi:hypothetical protein LLG88_13495 [bacterium]|nr:hypothetical protein [bacterium]